MNPFSAIDIYNDVQTGNRDTGGPRIGVAHVWPTRSPFDKGHVWAAPTRFLGHACPSGLQIFGQNFFFFFDQALPMRRAGLAHPWTTRGPPMDHPWPNRTL